MKCTHCGKQVSFFLAYKVKGKSGHFCSSHCANAEYPLFNVETYRGGLLELICFCFWFPYWILKTVVKLLLLPFKLFRKRK